MDRTVGAAPLFDRRKSRKVRQDVSGGSRPAPALPPGARNGRITAGRLALALLVLIALVADPLQMGPDHLQPVLYTAALLYLLFSVALRLPSLRDAAIPPPVMAHAYWADVLLTSLLVSLTGRSTSPWFPLFCFPILVAAATQGSRRGMQVVLVSALLYTAISVGWAIAGTPLVLVAFLLHLLTLLVLGYLLVTWIAQERQQKERLALLKELTDSANPRFGVDRTIGSMLNKVRAFYGTERCMLVTRPRGRPGYLLYLATKGNPSSAMAPVPLDEGTAKSLFGVAKERGVAYCSHARWLRQPWQARVTVDRRQPGPPAAHLEAECERVATFLESTSFIAVPVAPNNDHRGQLLLVDDAKRFDRSDIDFLQELVEHVLPVIENLRLVDHLMTEAAEEERRRIARDLHDSVIQAYIGFRIGVVALQRKAERGANLTGDIQNLLEMTEREIADLRTFVRGLHNQRVEEESLPVAIRRFTAKVAEVANLQIGLECNEALGIDGRLTTEAFQIVVEGVSNIRRHTDAAQACIRLHNTGSHLQVEIENDSASGERPAPFTPRSISERTAALGGELAIEGREEGGTRLLVQIPL